MQQVPMKQVLQALWGEKEIQHLLVEFFRQFLCPLLGQD
jgi:hypothetical protein